MLQNDASQTGSTPEARNDLDILNQCELGPATGNTITGAGTVTGSAGADTAAAGAMIVAVNGVESVGGVITVEGQYGTLTIQSDGSYTYTRSPNAPDGVNDVFTYTLADAGGARDTASLTIELRCQEDEPEDEAQTLINTTDGVVMLPAGVELSDIRVVGRDLVITMPDGSTITVPNGAVFVPQIVIGDVEVPPANLAALLIDSEPQPAAGTPESSGGNFAVDVPPLDPGVPLGDLLPPTDFGFTPPVFEEVGQVLDEEPEIEIQPDGQPASANAVDTVDEAGLPPRGDEPPGSNQESSSETTTGTILIDSPDGPSVVTVNGIAVTAVGQVIAGEFGTLTITSISDTEIGYSYTLGDNTSGDATHDDFSVTVTDSDGDADTATLTINIIDDVPTAVNDTDSIAAGEFGPATGNVLTDADAGDAGDSDDGADTVGADDAELTDVSGAGDTSVNEDGAFVVEGEYGVLTIAADGSYSYVRNAGTPGGVTDSFTYTLTDGDGDTDTATLTIDIGDLTPETGANPVVQLDDDALAGGNPGGTGDDADSVNASGTLSGAGGDGDLSFDLQTSGAPDGFTYVDGPDGSVLVQQNGTTVLTITIDAETGEYTVTQNAAIEHAAGNNENNVSFDIDYTVTDADGDAATGSLTINVDDDTPVVTQNTLGGTVDEDGLEAGIPGGTGDVAGENTVATGNVSALFSAGADTPLTFALLADTSGLPALTSNGEAVTYAVEGNVLTASAGGEAVFTFTLDADGSYSFELLGQLDHAPGGNENDLAISLGSIIEATDSDGDSVTAADGGLVITVDDDTPVATGEEIGATVDEDGVPGGIAGGTGDVAGENAVATGSVAALFASGADQPLTFTLLADTSGLPALTSNGVAVTYTVSGDTLTASAGGTDVFTFTLNADGSYTFTLLDQLDHAPGAGENDLAIALGSIIQATDADGDSVTAEGDGLVVTVDDDTPIASGEQVGGTVDEDGVPAGIPGGTGDVAGENTTVNGSVSTLFESGADQPLSYSLSTDTSGLPALTSNGVAVTYAVAGNVLTASAGGDVVFTLELNANGSYTFTLVDQLDHAEGGAENDLLLELGSIIEATDADGDTVTADADGLVITVDDDTPQNNGEQATIQVDEDGLAGGNAGGPGDDSGGVGPVTISIAGLVSSGADQPLSFALTGDTSGLPALTSNGVAVTYSVSGNVVTASAGGTAVFTIELDPATGEATFTLLDQIDHPSLDGQAGDNTENNLLIDISSLFTATDADGDTVELDAGSVVVDVDDDTPVATQASVGDTVDEDGLPGGIAGGTGDVAGEDTVATGSVTALFSAGADAPLSFSLSGDTSGLPALTSNGVAVTYTVSGNTLTASAGGETVFTFTLNANGSYTFTLTGQLDHAAGGGENDLGIALGSIIEATDADGDSVVAGDRGLVITVDDDTPTASDEQVSGTVDEDGVPNGIAGGTGDVAGENTIATGSVSALFNSGADQPLTFSLTADTSGLPALTSNGVPVTYTVVGDTLTASAGGTDVFTFTLNADGTYTFELLDQLDHAPGGNENDLAIELGSIIEATDADGDSVAAADDGLVITVDDDTPTASDAQVGGTVDEDGVPAGIPGGTGDVAGENTIVNGSVTTLFNSGADAPLSFSLLADTSGLPALTSNGVPVTYTVVGDTLTASAGGTDVFTFTLNADGTYTFELLDQLDHAPGGDENDLTLELGSIVQATDADGDSVTAEADGLVITVDDDTPANNANTLTFLADEDALPGGNAGGPGDGPGVGVGPITSSIAFLFGSGADQPLDFALSGDTSGLPALTSNGVAITYTVSGNTLTASAGANTVFTITLDPDTGEATFTLLDQIDHASLDGLAGDNSENNLQIDVSSLFTGTDADGDTVELDAGSFVIDIDDDTPTVSTAAVNGTVDEDGLAGGNPGGTGDVAGEATVATGSVTTLFNSGADAPLSFSLSGDTSGLPALTSNGVPVTYSVSGNTLTASAGGATVFTFTLNANGSYTFTLVDQLDHATGNAENDLTIALGSIVQATDADGDTVTAAPNGLVITVDDDTPVAANDTDSVGAPGTTAVGNVITDAHAGDSGDGDNGADSVGADQPGSVTAVVSVNEPGNTDSDASANFEIQGEFGVLVLNADGTYTYTRDAGTPGGAVDVFRYTLTDADGDSTTATLTITLGDANPVAGTVNVQLDDDALAGGNPGGTGDDANAVNTAGTLPGSGGDGTLTFDLQTTGAPSGFTYVDGPGGSVLVQQGGVTVLTITVDANTGAYTVTQNAPIDHPAGANENNVAFAISYTVTDEDTDVATGTININVDDDTPVATATQLGGTVDEDGVPGGIAGGTGDVAGESATATGSVATLFSAGADAPLTFSLLTTTGGLPALTSNGVPVTYAVVGDTLTASAGGNPVFTFELNADGTYTFTLLDQLDHAPGGNENDLTIALGSIIQATDADGDSVTAAPNGLVITVDDDTPTASTAAVGGTVDEDGIAGGNAGGTGDVAGEATVATGSVTTLFNSGADAPLSFSLSGDTSGLPALTSNGVPLTYTVSGNTLTASAGGATVFTFTLNANGSYTFTLVDQLDHAPGGNENDLTIALGSVVQATDADGDTVTAAPNGLVITVDDDTPVAANDTDSVGAPGTTATGNVITDAHAGDSGDSDTGADSVGADQPGSITGIASNNVPINSDTTFSSGVLEVQGQYGTLTIAANGTYTYTRDAGTPGGVNDVFTYTLTDADGDTTTATLTITLGDANPVAGTVNVQLDDDALAGGNPGGTGDDANAVNTAGTLPGSGGDGTLTFDLQTTGAPSGFTYVDGPGGSVLVQQGGVTVLTITVDANTGAYTVTQNAAIDHPAGNAENNVAFAISYTVTDEDTDVATGTININVDDDTPVATATQLGGTVDEDGVPGGIAGGTGDVTGEATTATGSVATLFSAGADAPLTFSLLTSTGGLPALTSNGVPVTYAVVGDTLTASAGGNPVFTFELNADGTYTFTLLDQLDHAPGGSENDLTIALGSIIQATDADGDSVTAAPNGLVITVDDDTPTASTVQLTGTVDEDGVPSGIAGGTGDVPGEATVATGSVTTLFNSGADAPLSFSLSGTTSGLPALTSNGVPVTYTVSGNTLTASAGGNTVFTFTLNANGSYTFTLVDQLDHAPGNAENDLAINLSSIIRATDADGDTVAAGSNGLVITVDDDSPVAFDPDPITAGLENEPGSTATADLDVDGQIENNVGADQPGLVQFANVTQASGLTSGGVAIEYFVTNNGQTLEARTGGASGDLVFTIDLNQNPTGTDTYTVEMFGTIDNGSGISFDDLTSTSAGNVNFRGVGADDAATTVDLLLSASNGGLSSTVNTDSDSIGSANQSMDSGESVRIDFVSNLTSSAGTPSGFGFDSHVSSNSFLGEIPQVQGNQAQTASFTVYALDSTLTESGDPDRNPAGGFSDATITEISEVTVVDYLTGNSTTLDISGVANGATVNVAYGISVTVNADGSVTFSGVQEGDSYGFRTEGGDFNAVVVQAHSSFDLGVFAIGTVNSGNPIDLNFDLQLTDADGDSVIVDDALDITIAPASSSTLAATSSVSPLAMEPIADKSSLLTNDNLDQQLKAVNAANSNTVFLGAIAAAGLTATPAAADHGFAPQAEFLTVNQAMFDSLDAHTSTMTIDTSSASPLVEKSAFAVQDGEVQSASSNHADMPQAELGIAAGEGNAHAAPVELPGGTDAPAQAPAADVAPVAMSVAMPSAEALAAADQPAVEGEKGTADVARVLADALAGGGDGPSIDAVIDAAAGGHGTGSTMGPIDTSLGHVPAWDMGAFHGFVGGYGPLTMEMTMIHPDAAPAHAA